MPDERKELQEIGIVARAFAEGRIGTCLASRKIRDLAYRAFADPLAHEEIRLFIGIDSEAMHLPVEGERERWDPRALQTKDEEMLRLDHHYREAALASARRILADPKYGVTDCGH